MSDVPTITVGGRQWPIPPLAFRQLRIVLPLLSKLGTRINLASATEEQIDALGTVVYAAMARGTPELTRQQFDEMAMTPVELLRALPTIVEQTGFGKGSGGDPLAPAEASPSTGTVS